MIVRKEKNGELLLIGQTDHSRLVGQFAAHWGNAAFAAPQPFESIARAAAFHDYGWLRYETNPLFNAEKGETPNFRDIPPSASRLEGYQWCVDWLLGADPYAALIVNMHRTGLSRARYGTISYPPQSARPLAPEVETFVTRNEQRQEEEKAAFDQRQLWSNYRLLQAWDLLGLYFCCQEPCEDYIEPVPQTYQDDKSAGVRLSLKPVGPRKVAIDPFPFDRRPFPVQLTCKRLPQVTYPDAASFQRAYFQAPTELMEFELV